MDRILDANSNRAAEGLRVLEELARFGLASTSSATRLKTLRHCIRQWAGPTLVASRDTAGDVGTAIKSEDEYTRTSLVAVVRANAARVAEALRSLEEWAKLGRGEAGQIEQCRYQLYDIERDLLASLPVHKLWNEKVYALVDTSCTDDPVACAQRLVQAGAGIVQLRAKELSERSYAELAQAVQTVVRDNGALFIVNDHVAVAAALAADGIHVGQDDLGVDYVRRVVGPLMLIGLSTHTPEQISAARTSGADYIGLGPMFATSTKAHEAVRGPQLLAAVADAYPLPSYAIGGLTLDRVVDLAPTIAHGVAIAGALCRSTEPAPLVQQLKQTLDGA